MSAEALEPQALNKRRPGIPEEYSGFPASFWFNL